jgi:hypothetical protein
MLMEASHSATVNQPLDTVNLVHDFKLYGEIG